MKYLLEFLIFTDFIFKSKRAFLGKPRSGDILKNYKLNILFCVLHSNFHNEI